MYGNSQAIEYRVWLSYHHVSDGMVEWFYVCVCLRALVCVCVYVCSRNRRASSCDGIPCGTVSIWMRSSAVRTDKIEPANTLKAGFGLTFRRERCIFRLCHNVSFARCLCRCRCRCWVMCGLHFNYNRSKNEAQTRSEWIKKWFDTPPHGRRMERGTGWGGGRQMPYTYGSSGRRYFGVFGRVVVVVNVLRCVSVWSRLYR